MQNLTEINIIICATKNFFKIFERIFLLTEKKLRVTLQDVYFGKLFYFSVKIKKAILNLVKKIFLEWSERIAKFVAEIIFIRRTSTIYLVANCLCSSADNAAWSS